MKAKFAGVIALTENYVTKCGGKLSPKDKAMVGLMSKSVDMTDLVAAKMEQDASADRIGNDKFCSILKDNGMFGS